VRGVLRVAKQMQREAPDTRHVLNLEPAQLHELRVDARWLQLLEVDSLFENGGPAGDIEAVERGAQPLPRLLRELPAGLQQPRGARTPAEQPAPCFYARFEANRMAGSVAMIASISAKSRPAASATILAAPCRARGICPYASPVASAFIE
jgi:hypothetical protein